MISRFSATMSLKPIATENAQNAGGLSPGAWRSVRWMAISCMVLVAGVAAPVSGGEPLELQLRPAAEVDSEGIFLSQVVQTNLALPVVRLAEAPAFGKVAVLSRAQVSELVHTAVPDLGLTNWTGGASVRVSRRSRALPEAEVLQLLTSTLQKQFVKEKGELELRFSRAWTPVQVPDEPLKLVVLDMPTMGVTPNFIARFELTTAQGEHLGPWQAPLLAHAWREVWVAHTALKRGDSLREADVARERRDVLLCRDTLAEFGRDAATLEAAESVPAGTPLLARAIKARAVVHRGQTVAALVQDGALAITLKVEVLEEGAPGQLIRVRNPLSRRDLRGKVLDDQTVLVAL
jgi:flagellar basal body P-ring formation protein FlgA